MSVVLKKLGISLKQIFFILGIQSMDTFGILNYFWNIPFSYFWHIITPFLPFPKYKFPTQSYNILIFSNQILILHHICITHTHDSVNSLHSWLQGLQLPMIFLSMHIVSLLILATNPYPFKHLPLKNPFPLNFSQNSRFGKLRISSPKHGNS